MPGAEVAQLKAEQQQRHSCKEDQVHYTIQTFILHVDSLPKSRTRLDEGNLFQLEAPDCTGLGRSEIGGRVGHSKFRALWPLKSLMSTNR